MPFFRTVIRLGYDVDGVAVSYPIVVGQHVIVKAIDKDAAAVVMGFSPPLANSHTAMGNVLV